MLLKKLKIDYMRNQDFFFTCFYSFQILGFLLSILIISLPFLPSKLVVTPFCHTSVTTSISNLFSRSHTVGWPLVSYQNIRLVVTLLLREIECAIIDNHIYCLYIKFKYDIVNHPTNNWIDPWQIKDCDLPWTIYEECRYRL